MFKIAIVEDNQTAMAKLQGYLERYAQENNENFDIAAFGDALAFLDSYRRIYDMVFMDIELPFINGMEAAQRLRDVGRILRTFKIKKECGGNRQWQRRFLRNWAANTTGKAIT